MLLTVDTPDSCQYRVYDCTGQVIPFVTSFDTETEEIEMSIKIGTDEEKLANNLLMQLIPHEDGQMTYAPILIKFKLPGAYVLKNNEPIH